MMSSILLKCLCFACPLEMIFLSVQWNVFFSKNKPFSRSWLRRYPPDFLSPGIGKRLVGQAAKSQAAMNPKNTIHDVKRLDSGPVFLIFRFCFFGVFKSSEVYCVATVDFVVLLCILQLCLQKALDILDLCVLFWRIWSHSLCQPFLEMFDISITFVCLLFCSLTLILRRFILRRTQTRSYYGYLNALYLFESLDPSLLISMYYRPSSSVQNHRAALVGPRCPTGLCALRLQGGPGCERQAAYWGKGWMDDWFGRFIGLDG